MLPASQVSGILPELEIRLNRSTYNTKNISEVDFMNSFLIISSPDALSFFSFFIHIRISSRVILSFGITGKLLNVIKSMYSKLKACVRLDSNYSDIFTCNVGPVQGDSLPPFLYSLYVNDIEVELINQGCQSYELKKLNLFFLMYADDTVIFSENVEDLQNLINSVS